MQHGSRDRAIGISPGQAQETEFANMDASPHALSLNHVLGLRRDSVGMASSALHTRRGTAVNTIGTVRIQVPKAPARAARSIKRRVSGCQDAYIVPP